MSKPLTEQEALTEYKKLVFSTLSIHTDTGQEIFADKFLEIAKGYAAGLEG